MAIKALQRLQATAKTKQVADVSVKDAAKIVKDVFASVGIKLKTEGASPDDDYISCSGRFDGQDVEFAIHLERDKKHVALYFDFIDMPAIGDDREGGFYLDEDLPSAITNKTKLSAESAMKGLNDYTKFLDEQAKRSAELCKWAKQFVKGMQKLQNLMAKNAK